MAAGHVTWESAAHGQQQADDPSTRHPGVGVVITHSDPAAWTHSGGGGALCGRPRDSRTGRHRPSASVASVPIGPGWKRLRSALRSCGRAGQSHLSQQRHHDRRTTCQAERRRGRGQNEPEPWCQLNVTYAINETKKTE